MSIPVELKLCLSAFAILMPVGTLFASLIYALSFLPTMRLNLFWTIIGAMSFFGGLLYIGIKGENKIREESNINKVEKYA